MTPSSSWRAGRRDLPEHVGPYRLEDILGRGGMGEVYLARDERLRRRVAIKQVRPDKDLDQRARRRLLREARAAASLAHPAIVPVFDIVESDDRDWIVMELVDGQTLSHLLKKGPLEVATAVHIGREIAEGLAYAHEQGFVHRDLKVENVMVASNGRARILDFGLAKNLSAAEESLTAEGALVGTWRAMSPEQAMGREVDHRSDIFSLGTLLYECLTGIRPFDGDSTATILTMVCAHQQTPIHQIRADIPASLSRLIDRLLEKVPAARPDSKAVVQALAHIGRTQGLDPLADSPDTARESSLSTDDWADPAISTIVGPLATPVLDAAKNTRSRKPSRGATIAIGLASAMLVVGSYRYLDDWHPDSSRSTPTIDNEKPAIETPYELYQQGLEQLTFYYRPNAIDKAITLFERVVTAQPDHAGAHAGLAEAYREKALKQNDPLFTAQALTAVEHALALDGHLAVAQVTYGRILTSTGDYSAAQAAFDTALLLEPNNAGAHVGMGLLHDAQSESKKAETWLKQATQLDPSHQPAHNQLGVLFYTQGRYEEAEASFKQSRDLTPDAPTVHRNLAGALHMQGKYAEAASVLQASLVIDPRASVYNNLGTLLYFQGKYSEAAKAFEKAVELGPNLYSRWANLGDAYRWSPGQRHLAQEPYRVALRLLGSELESSPSNVNLLSHGALYGAKLANCTTSLDFSDRLDLETTDRGVIFFRLGVAAELCSRRDRALTLLGKAIAHGYSRKELLNEPELASLRQDARFHRLRSDSQHEH